VGLCTYLVCCNLIGCTDLKKNDMTDGGSEGWVEGGREGEDGATLGLKDG
jgi:hypothetical protein